jgi:hypothetical protein
VTERQVLLRQAEVDDPARELHSVHPPPVRSPPCLHLAISQPTPVRGHPRPCGPTRLDSAGAVDHPEDLVDDLGERCGGVDPDSRGRDVPLRGVQPQDQLALGLRGAEVVRSPGVEPPQKKVAA